MITGKQLNLLESPLNTQAYNANLWKTLIALLIQGLTTTLDCYKYICE